MRYETAAIHGGRDTSGEQIRGESFPIYLTSTFTQDGVNDFREFMYSRSKNPTRDNLEQLVAQLEGAKHGLAMSSGMAATALAFSLVKSGEKVLINSNVYGGTCNFVSHVFCDRGIDFEIVTDFANCDFDAVEGNVSTVFLETPSNPLLEVTDIADVAARAHAKGWRVIVDNTFMTSYLQRPLDLGADVVVYSATKYYAGHSDVIAGLVVLNDDQVFDKLKFNQKTLGGMLDPFSSFLVARGIQTLPLRMDRHEQNALAVAKFCEESRAAKAVYYPGLPSNPGYELQRRQARGNGAVLSVDFKDEYDLDAFCHALRFIDLAVSLGGIESLVCCPATMTHEEYSPELQAQIGITKTMLRFSVGVEAIDDLLEDLQKALEAAKR